MLELRQSFLSLLLHMITSMLNTVLGAARIRCFPDSNVLSHKFIVLHQVGEHRHVRKYRKLKESEIVVKVYICTLERNGPLESLLISCES